MNRDEIMDRLAAPDWKTVKNEFGGRSESDILQVLDEMYRGEPDNAELAAAIYSELN